MSIKNQKEMSHYLRIALIILVPVAAILLFCSIFVFSIKSVTLSGVPEEGAIRTMWRRRFLRRWSAAIPWHPQKSAGNPQILRWLRYRRTA